MNKKMLFFSFVFALFLCMGEYLLNNQPLFTGEDLNTYAWLQWIKDKLVTNHIDDDLTDAIFVNVAYDKVLVSHRNEYGEPVGVIDITDREKMGKFLSAIHDADYRYILLDVRFEKGSESDSSRVDSFLFKTIGSMDRICVANHVDMELQTDFPAHKAALADYYSTIVATNFARYEYSRDGEESMPLRAYRELTGNQISSFGPLYFSDGKLCRNSLFPLFSKESFSKKNETEFSDGFISTKPYYYLGNDILTLSDADIRDMVKGKIVVVGNFDEDVHDTYVGLRSGSLICYRSLSMLLQGKHIVNWMSVVLIFLVYFCISCTLFMRTPLLGRLPLLRQMKSKLLLFVVSLLSYTLVLSLLNVVIFYFQNEVHSILMPSVCFALLRHIINYSTFASSS